MFPDVTAAQERGADEDEAKLAILDGFLDLIVPVVDPYTSIEGFAFDPRDNVAHMRIAMSISGLPQLSNVLSRIAQLPNIISARRKK